MSSMKTYLSIIIMLYIMLYNMSILDAFKFLLTKSYILPIISSISSIILTTTTIDEQLSSKDITVTNNPNTQIQPSDKDNQLVQMAFRDFDNKRFEASDKEFTLALSKWRELNRPRDEIVSLLKARANVRVDIKEFDDAILDYNECIRMMSVDGEYENGLGRYPEYPDAFVGRRALAREGLADWSGALKDYDKAISLWGGTLSGQTSKVKSTLPSATTNTNNNDYASKSSIGINPYVLTFRGNVLSRLNRYEDALVDYDVASSLFISNGRDIARYSDARANYALTLYELGRTDESLKTMMDIIRKNPGYADMHVALAADYWSQGNYIDALKEWRFTCDRIEVGCDAYKDISWVSKIRRWPISLTTKLQQFLNREIPDKLKGEPGSILAPIK